MAFPTLIIGRPRGKVRGLKFDISGIRLMRRTVLPLLLLPLFMLATALFAQDGFEGRYTFSHVPGSAPLMILELAPDGAGFIGIGQTTEDLPGVGGAVVTVVGGAAYQGNLQLDLDLAPFDGTAPFRAQFQVIDGSDPVATLVYFGNSLDGVFVAAGGGPAATRPQADGTCAEMDALTAEMNATGGPETVQAIRGLYTEAGLAFGGTQTPERCAQVLDGLRQMQEASEGIGPNCRALDGLLDAAFSEMARLGAYESAELDGILAQAGLMVFDLNPNGVWTEATCGAALGGVEAYTARLRATATPEESPEDFASEPMRVLPVAGFAPANGGGSVELWAHNGSEMVLESGPGDALSFWYWTPRPSLGEVGVRQGTLLFDGRQNGTFVEGNARLYTFGCGVYSYYVSGSWAVGTTEFTLRGERPVISGTCAVEDIAVDTLVFTYAGPRPVDATAPETTPPGNRPETQVDPQAPASNGQVLQPLGSATITNQDALRPVPLDEPDIFDTPAFGVWAEIYEVYDVGRGDTLNLRSGPGTGYQVLTQLPWNAIEIEVIGTGCTPDLDQIAFTSMSVARQAEVLANRWCAVRWGDWTGWVSGRYIRPY